MKFKLACRYFFAWAVAVFFLAAVSRPAYAASAESADVVATGVGLDADAALKNALFNAVEQAVGLFVDAETLVKNDQIVKDQILTYSDGYVEHFERVHEAKRADGLFEVKIKAIVKRRQLIEKLKQSNISIKQVDGQSLFGEIATNMEADKKGAALLEKALEGLPLNLLKAEIIDQKPAITQKDEQTIRAAWNVKISFDQTVYYEKVEQNLANVLNQIAKRKSQTYQIEQVDRDKSSIDYYLVDAYCWDAKEPGKIDRKSVLQKPLWTARGVLNPELTRLAKDEFLVSLNIGRNAKADNRRWNWYVLDRTMILPIVKEAAARSPRLRIAFLNSSGEPIREDEIDFNNNRPAIKVLNIFTVNGSERISSEYIESHFPNFITADTAKTMSVSRPDFDSIGFTAAISPFFAADGKYTDSFSIQWETDFTLDEVKNISSLKCYFIDSVYVSY